MQPNWKKGNGSVLYFMYMYKYVRTNEYSLYDSIFIEVTVHE